MVHFTKLRLAGFKSFVEATELSIEPGTTGIVGPNGCGKSNLVEALRWAMGETSAKRLRGGEMDDVIFGGTGARPPRNVAEVTLVLDNRDRKVPAQFNDAEELEIIRRIDRGSGSTYLVNGSEVRARDVHLLFADAATGAHSTALVSQGRIGAIINAKPADRRSLLEEAAGITGLHSRRHEAELRLKGAEANLARLEDVIITLDAQFQALKKQARQASRYRNISDHLKRAEAVLLYLDWQELTRRLESGRAALTAAEEQVTLCTQAAATATVAQSDALSVLPPLRQAEAEAAAELQRVTLARDALDQEAQRIATARDDAGRRLQEIVADIQRETSLSDDARIAQDALQTERQALQDAISQEGDAIATAARLCDEAQSNSDTLENELSAATQSAASLEAQAAALQRRIHELNAQLGRLSQRADDLQRERQSLAAELTASSGLAEAEQKIIETDQAVQNAQTRASEAESRRLAAEVTLDQRRSAVSEVNGEHGRLLAEEQALAKLLSPAENSQYPAVLDAITVLPGYEAALGAALGDDLMASLADEAPMRWALVNGPDDSAEFPAEVEPLINMVKAPEALARRLRHVGVVRDTAEGNLLRDRLARGQRLVSRDGALWRWDGFTVAAGAPTAAAVRLQQQNRLQEVRAERENIAADLAAARDHLADAETEFQDASQEDRAARQAVQAAFAAHNQARAAQAEIARKASAATARLSAAEEAEFRLREEIAAAAANLDTAKQEQEILPDLNAARDRVASLRMQVAEKRSVLVESRAGLERLRREAETRRSRVQAIDRDLASWQDRAAGAARQLENFAARKQGIDSEIAELDRKPAEIAEKRHSLGDIIDRAASARRDAADRLAAAEVALAEADRMVKQEESRLAAAREDRVRAEAALQQADEAQANLILRIQERLDCAPENLVELGEIDPERALPDREGAENRLQRLVRERDAMGPVNLRAEVEAEELEQQIGGMQTEKEDLVQAIARLRQGIASLNREGRERLLAAFEVVNGHFGQLFGGLFGGGRAYLQLTEAEDPLDAGLEIMASPPGKRLQSLSLLSGGEQALTALALLFAVFLTNPAPICVLDEVDAPLDDANVERFCDLVQQLSRETQTRFLIITHHRLTMARMDRLFGVTMAERGVSQLVSVDLQEAERIRATA